MHSIFTLIVKNFLIIFIICNTLSYSTDINEENEFLTQPISPQQINLLETKKSVKDKNSIYWNVYLKKSKIGKVSIKTTRNELFNEHASIQIAINKRFQGKHIGRWVIRQACEQSSYNEVYAYMRKSNIASQKAAFAAGFFFLPLRNPKFKQLVMKWLRK